MPASRFVLAAAVFALGAARSAAADAPTVSFDREVMAVLSRAGCNAGACHGNLNGKGGFKLSLRGEDPAFDRAALTRDMLARRADPHHPDGSLILLKATGGVPHEGGIRFSVLSTEYSVLNGPSGPQPRIRAFLSGLPINGLGTDSQN